MFYAQLSGRNHRSNKNAGSFSVKPVHFNRFLCFCVKSQNTEGKINE